METRYGKAGKRLQKQANRQARRAANVANWRALEREVRQGLPAGVTLRINPVRPRGEHWMFDADGVRVCELWPSRGTWWSKATNEKGTVHTAGELLDIVEHYLGLVHGEPALEPGRASAGATALPSQTVRR